MRPEPAAHGSDGLLRWSLFATSIGVQLVVLYWPRAVGPTSDLPLDKVVHAAIFAAVAWTGARAGVPARPLVAALLAHAVLSEVAQAALLTQRSGDPVDALTDAAGALLGAAAAVRRPPTVTGCPQVRNRR